MYSGGWVRYTRSFSIGGHTAKPCPHFIKQDVFMHLTVICGDKKFVWAKCPIRIENNDSNPLTLVWKGGSTPKSITKYAEQKNKN